MTLTRSSFIMSPNGLVHARIQAHTQIRLVVPGGLLRRRPVDAPVAADGSVSGLFLVSVRAGAAIGTAIWPAAASRERSRPPAGGFIPAGRGLDFLSAQRDRFQAD